MPIVIFLSVTGLIIIAITVFAVRKLGSSKEEKDIVSLTDIDEIKKLDREQKAAGKDGDGQALSRHLISESRSSTQTEPGKGESPGPETGDPALLRKKAEQLAVENERLKKALQREVAMKGKGGGGGSIEKILEKERQITQLNQTLAKVKNEVQPLKDERDELRNKNEELGRKVDELSKQCEELGSREESKISALESELESLQEENSKLAVDKNLFESIKKEKENLAAENSKFESRLKEIQETMVRSREEHERKMDHANQTIRILKNEVRDLKKVDAAEIKKQMKDTVQFLETLKLQIHELSTDRNALKEELKLLKSYNVQLNERERMLQYELAKSRAQSVGLEKICEDFRIKIEQKDNADRDYAGNKESV